MAQETRSLTHQPVRLTNLLALGLTITACSIGSGQPGVTDNGQAPPSTTPVAAGSRSPADQALREAQAALDRAGGYTLTVEQSNFVLPQWGGSDGGTVRVSGDGLTATAELARTGEGGPYSIVFTADQTFFRRSTCPTWARVPGGGRDVLRPFLLPKTQGLANATNVSRDGPLIRARIEGIGDAEIELDAGSRLPVQITSQTATNTGKALRWQFSRWGEAVSTSAPNTGGVDRGPGGNPC